MSAVYKAFDPNLKRVVAIKVIHPHLAGDPEFVKRFEEEASAVASFRHPNIVQVYDFNRDDDLYYMVQEFIPGITLQERLRQLSAAKRHMPVTEAIRFTFQICNATEYAHQRGMIHRDIKPANIMLDVHGQAILMDFGIVKIVGGERHTATGAVVGTALYMSPELIRGETPDPRSDLYSLGVTLFEMVSGHPPFEADSAMALMMMHINDPMPDIQSMRPDVPTNLVLVIQKALAKVRDQRYASMADMADALTAVLDQLEGRASSGVPLVAPVGMVSAQPSQAEPTSIVYTTGTNPSFQRESSSQNIPQTVAAGAAISPPNDGRTSQVTYQVPSQMGTTTGKITGTQTVPKSAGKGDRKLPWMACAVVALLVLIPLVVGGFFIGRRLLLEPTQVAVVIADSTDTLPPPVTSTATLIPTPSITPTITPTPLPTDTPTPDFSPTPTIPAGVPYARIDRVALDSSGFYIVDYETFEYTPRLDDYHMTFYFDTLLPEEIGTSADKSSYMFAGPNPFGKFSQSKKPDGASQVCVLVANPDHSVRFNSGNCVQLPDVVIAAPAHEMACLYGPGQEFPPVTHLKKGQMLLVHGLSSDEGWWNLTVPQNPEETCWLQRDMTTFAGDISTLPLIEPPSSIPETNLTDMSAKINRISLDGQGRYIVTYATNGFSEQLPGTHIHFFFDTTTPDQVGISGSGAYLMYGGPAPFTGYTTADRPPGAKQMCVLVANPDHTIIANSGNCVNLPVIQNTNPDNQPSDDVDDDVGY
jgi:serine/threonine protein kinase